MALSLTQQQLSELRDLHRTFIGSVERGERDLSILNLRLIARVLRVPPPELFPEPGAGQDETLTLKSAAKRYNERFLPCCPARRRDRSESRAKAEWTWVRRRSK